ncbi:hypothetical protein [Holdemania massiliensis]|uniref:hypothetical protein n=1 Tax=Holdemania massiliensis TaxID=1468449 RepID=UPI001F058147|nr:hypothetical protein [Holdemania massiliensis]MCH1942154.1 hypothetical protein [Holdemania massiliensis]
MTQQKKEINKKNWIVLVLILIVLFLIAALGFVIWKGNQKENPRLEANATVGMMPGKTAEQIEAELNQQVTEGMIAFTINSAPVFEDWKGEIWFENPESNNKYTRLELELDVTDPYAESLNNRTLCQTGLLKPGSYMDEIELSQKLPEGTYRCTARIYAYKLDGESYLGEVQAGLQITVR